MIPNIFKYATKELSQDAFICWLVACAREDEGALKDRGAEFIRTLWNHDRGSTADKSCGITDVSEPERQYLKVDVYFQARVNGSLVSFVVEDKTDTQMHGKQLTRNREAIEGDDRNEDEVRLIYYKTGYVFEDERQRAEKAGYAVFTAEDMLAFLTGNPVEDEHEILRQYRERLTTLTDKRNAGLKAWDMEFDFVQFEFMRILMNRLVENMSRWTGFVNKSMRYPDDKDRHSVGRGRNRGGAGPWTQYWFCDYLFWRLDAYKPLRLMVWTENALSLDDWNAHAWNQWIERFGSLQEEIQLPAADFVRRMYRGEGFVNEGTVGAIDVHKALSANGGDLERTLDKILTLHTAFVERISP